MALYKIPFQCSPADEQVPRAAKRTQVNISQPTGTVGQLRSEDSFLWPIIMGCPAWILTAVFRPKEGLRDGQI